ncbi:MAG: hypothetical protein L0Y64_01715, partial [Myxococcaceae bacterium]|nr:hypothetical protein [Myxococcaceae bacterium]
MAKDKPVNRSSEVAIVNWGALDEGALVGVLEQGGKGTATSESVQEAMGNTAPDLEEVSIKHGGTCMFELPGGRKVETFLGVIVAHTYRNAFYKVSLDDAGDEVRRPDCSSDDGTNVNTGVPEAQNSSCLTCTRNRDARDPEAREAAFNRPSKGEDGACSNYLMLAVCLPGLEVPYVMQVPSSSFRNWATYVQQLGTRGRFQPHEAVTQFKLTNRKKGAYQYSVLELARAGELPGDLRAAFGGQAEGYRAMLRRRGTRRSTAPARARTGPVPTTSRWPCASRAWRFPTSCRCRPAPSATGP